MKKSQSAKFIKTAIFPKDYPIIQNLKGKLLPEIAVAGRSNVGKSSLLNHLFQSNNLVKTSSTPGKTQAVNFFSWNDEISFADLPGYGYAAVPLQVKKQWGPMVKSYLEERDTLKLILFLLDIRRIPNADDRQFIEWVVHQQKAMILVLTKIDKLNQRERKIQTDKILNELNMLNLHYIHYSTLKNVGRKELIYTIKDALKDESSV
jgi:GTP-binding protein